MADSSQDIGMDIPLPGGQVEPHELLQFITTRDPANVPSSIPEVTREESPLEAQNEAPSQSLQSCLSNEMEENRPDSDITTSCDTTQQENPLVPHHPEVSNTTAIASAVDGVNSSHDSVKTTSSKIQSQPDAESDFSTKEMPTTHKEQTEDVDSSTGRDSETQDETPVTRGPVDMKTFADEPMEVSRVENPADATPALETFQETSETMDTSEPAWQQKGNNENEDADGTMSSRFPVETNQSVIDQSEELESCEKSIAQPPVVDKSPRQQTQQITTDTQVCFDDSQSKGDVLGMTEKSLTDIESTSGANNQSTSISVGNDSVSVLSLETEIGRDGLSVKSPPDDVERDGTYVALLKENTNSEDQNAVTSKNDPVSETVQDGGATVIPLNEETQMDNPSWSENKDAPTSSISVASFPEKTGEEPPHITTPSEETVMDVDGPRAATVEEDTGIVDPTMDDDDAEEEDARLGSGNEDAGVEVPSVAPLKEDAEMDGSDVASLNELAVMGDQSVDSLNEDTKIVDTTVTSVDEDEAIVSDLSVVCPKEDASSLREDAETDGPGNCATKDYPSVPSLNEATGTDGTTTVSLNEEVGGDSPSVTSLKEDATSLTEDAEADGPLEFATKDYPSVPSLSEVTGTDGDIAKLLSEETGRDSPSVASLKGDTGRDSPSIASTKGDTGRDSPSVASGRSSPSQKTRKRPMSRDSVLTEAYEQKFILGVFPAENLFEYQWPQEKGSEWYFVQEQVCEFLQVKSFKRKYPDLERRVMDIKEKEFLRERGVVTEEQVTLGLTALRADEVYDLMLKDAPEKSAEYARVLHEKEKQNISNKHKQYEPPTVDSSKVQEYIKKAVRQAADYNAALMAERREERLYYFDMQTLTVQKPASKMKKLSKEATKLGPYPVAVIPGQYQNYYNSYTSDELKYFPLSTSLYGPMAPHRQTDLAPPQTDAEVLSDNETVLSADPLEYSSESEESMGAPIPMELNQSNLELQSEVTAAADISLASEPPVYKPKDIPDAICGLCLKDSSQNKMGMHEKMIHCSQCDNSGHPSCLDMNESMVEVIQTYPWQCMECKTCFHCGDPTHEDKMMFCDMCDRGYHTFCVGLQDIPTGLWACESCQTTDDTPAALAPHVPSPPPSAPTPTPEESAPVDRSSTPVVEASSTTKKRGRKSGTPGAGNNQSTPGGKKKRTSTPTPKKVKKK